VLGAVFVLLSALCYAGYLIGSGHLLQRVGSVRFACLASLAATVGVLAHFLVVGETTALAAQPAPVHGWALLMAAVSTVLPIVLTSAGIRRLGSGNAAMISTLGPAATILLGHALLDEPITTVQLAGAALVVAGVVAIALKREVKADAVGA
jgi:drug/metabolite transporter (DMT)-like permease